jgi:hypothetical protein
MGYLFYPYARVYYHPAKRGPNSNIEQADGAVVAIFRALQNARRQQETRRQTLDRMPASHEERRCWKRLIRYFTNLPPLASAEVDHSSIRWVSRNDYWRYQRTKRR